MNSALRELALPEDQLQRTFERCWPEFEETLTAIENMPTKQPEPRSTEEMIGEILVMVRDLKRIPIQSFLIPRLAEVGVDVDIPHAVHELGKYSQDFPQMAGRVNRKKINPDESA